MIERFARLVNGVSFHRGLAVGALVGAAIAGSTLWTRLRPETKHVAPRSKNPNDGTRRIDD